MVFINMTFVTGFGQRGDLETNYSCKNHLIRQFCQRDPEDGGQLRAECWTNPSVFVSGRLLDGTGGRG